MEPIIDVSGERCPDTGHLLEIRNTRAHHTLQAAEVREERAPSRRAKARHGLQDRFVVASGPLAPMTGDREAMGFVSHALDEP
jgi:hypothetical protein